MAIYNPNAYPLFPNGKTPGELGAKINITNTPGNGTSGATGAVITAGNAQNYNVSTNKALTIWISHQGTLSQGSRNFFPIVISDVGASAATTTAATAAELVTAINANELAALHVTASVSSNSLRLTTKHKGTGARIYVTGSANTPLGFTQVADASSAAGVGVASEVELTVTTPDGELIRGADVDIVLYAASTGSTKDSTATVQKSRAHSGGIVSGNYSNTFTGKTGDDGTLKVQVIDSGSSAQTAFLLATVQTSTNTVGRSEVTTGT